MGDTGSLPTSLQIYAHASHEATALRVAAAFETMCDAIRSPTPARRRFGQDWNVTVAGGPVPPQLVRDPLAGSVCHSDVR
jgi:hypothetical protein